MLNNRGQSLVMFILLLPIMIMIMLMVIDIGKMILLRNELDNINYLVIDYGLDNLDNDDIINKLNDIVYKNKSSIYKVSVKVEDKKINVILEDGVNLTLLKNINIFRVKSSYIGYFDLDKKIIERNK